MKWHDYVLVALSRLWVFGLGYSWVRWFKTGRHQPGKRTGRAVTALVDSALPPLLLLSLFPMCYVPRSDAFIGLAFAAVGLLLALMGRGKLRWLLAAYALVCYLMLVEMIPTSVPPGRSRPSQTAGEQRGVPAKWRVREKNLGSTGVQILPNSPRFPDASPDRRHSGSRRHAGSAAPT
jgi:hypothetical protein